MAPVIAAVDLRQLIGGHFAKPVAQAEAIPGLVGGQNLVKERPPRAEVLKNELADVTGGKFLQGHGLFLSLSKDK